jgi:hypothetical protein
MGRELGGRNGSKVGVGKGVGGKGESLTEDFIENNTKTEQICFLSISQTGRDKQGVNRTNERGKLFS